MKFDIIPFNPISVPPDILLVLKNPRASLIVAAVPMSLHVGSRFVS